MSYVYVLGSNTKGTQESKAHDHKGHVKRNNASKHVLVKSAKKASSGHVISVKSASAARKPNILKPQAIASGRRQSSHPIDPEVARRIGEIQSQAGVYERVGKGAMANGQFASALAYFQAEDSLWVAAGFQPIVRYRDVEIECAFQLRDYRSVVSMADQNNLIAPMTRATVGLALLRLGEFARAVSLYTPEVFCTKDLSSEEYRHFLPSAASAESLECGFLLARGANLCFSLEDERALPELRQADRLIPHQPFVAFFLGDALQHLDRSNEAAKYIKDAATLGGVYGSMAFRFGEPMVHQPKPSRPTARGIAP